MAEHLKRVHPGFPSQDFVTSASKGFQALEMKGRVVQIAQALEQSLPGPYPKNLKIILKALAPVGATSRDGLEGFSLWPVTYYIESKGLSDFEASMEALKAVTRRFTSEFGIRPFLQAYPERVYPRLQEWTQDSCEHVRRWTSEGTRPNLPWGQNITHIKSHLGQNLKILEALKEDPSLYVRKSVANHLNDIAWIEPRLVLKTLEAWSSIKTPEMTWLRKRALRNLLKQGNPQALRLLGFDTKAPVEFTKFTVSPRKIKEGESLTLKFEIKNSGHQSQAFMVDYVIDFLRANGSHSPKVFKLKTVVLEAGEAVTLQKEVKVRKVTTRAHYPGKQGISVQLNGIRRGKSTFHLE